MATGTQSPVTAIPDAVVAAVLNGWAAGIRPAVAFLMIGTIFGSMLIPMLISLFYFSTPDSRRTPIFIYVVFTVLLGITLAITNDVIEVHTFLSPLVPVNAIHRSAFAVGYMLCPWIVDNVLLIRLLAVFPFNRTPLPKFIAIFAFPIAVKSVRLAVVLKAAIHWATVLLHSGDPIAASLEADSGYEVKVEWALQIFDNGYASAFFLWKLRGTFTQNHDSGRVTDGRSESLSGRIRTLCWLALTNFVFPVIFNIVQFIVLFAAKSPFTSSYLMFLNSYISIIGAVFATVWSSSKSHQYGSSASTTQHTGSTARSGRSNTLVVALAQSQDRRTSNSEKDLERNWESDESRSYLPRTTTVDEDIPLDVRACHTEEKTA